VTALRAPPLAAAVAHDEQREVALTAPVRLAGHERILSFRGRNYASPPVAARA
jgi:hypothetical protein